MGGNWLELTEKMFDWITYVVQNYELEDFEGRRTISLEPAERALQSSESPALESIRPRWRRVVDDVRTAIEANHTQFRWFAKTVLAVYWKYDTGLVSAVPFLTQRYLVVVNPPI